VYIGQLNLVVFCPLPRLLGNPYSEGCKATMFLVSDKVVKQPFGSSGLLDSVIFNELIFLLSFRINSLSN
jgi:hypothetical protein